MDKLINISMIIPALYCVGCVYYLASDIASDHREKARRFRLVMRNHQKRIDERQ